MVELPKEFSMNNAESGERPLDDYVPANLLRPMQIIAGAQIAGLLFFLAFALFQVFQKTGGDLTVPMQGLPPLTMLGLGMFAVCGVLAFVLPNIIASRMLRELAAKNLGTSTADLSKKTSGLIPIRQSTMIIGLALLEGTGFLNCIAYMIEASILALVVVLMTLLLMIVKFPTEGRVRNWIQERAGQLGDMA
jgi:hypothetical protein